MTMQALVQSMKLAVRHLWRHPGFALTAVLTLALAIGANTAVFSLVNALLLNDLPYAQPERIGTIYGRTIGQSASIDEPRTVDGEQWELLRDHVPSLLSAVAGTSASGTNLLAGSHAQYVLAGRVSSNYFDVLALRPIIGRNFSAAEDRPQGPKAAILSHGLWRTAFNGSADVLGQSVRMKGEPFAIIGVLPEGATTPLNAQIYVALQPSREGEGRAANFRAIMRLRDGATWQQADVEVERTLANSVRALNFSQKAIDPTARRTYHCVPLQQAETATLRSQVLALMFASGFILLIACANLAGLTLVRVSRRAGEIATRLALGASRWQIQRQLWVENLFLAVMGGVAGIAVGFLLLRGLLLLLPEHFLPIAQVHLDGRVLAFTLSLSLLTSVIFGMLPAFTTKHVVMRSTMGGRTIAGSGMRVRHGLIAGEVALTVVLLAAAGLLVRTLIHLQTLSPGFSPTGVIAAKASLDEARYHDPAAFRRLLDESLTTMRRIPGVAGAAVALSLPYERAVTDGSITLDGREAGRTVETRSLYVTPGYFETLQIPVLAGRTFTGTDGPQAQRVVIVNQAFARKYYGDANPLSRSLNTDMMIVGVVSDTVGRAGVGAGLGPLTREAEIYRPAAQIDDARFLATIHVWTQPSWVVRATGPIGGLTAQMQRALAATDPNLPFSGFYSMSDLMAAALATQRVQVALLTAMAGLALVLSALGIFTLVANTVGQRTREIGIRLALGSTVRQAMIHASRSAVGASALGLVLGLILGAATLRALRSALYGVGVYDTQTIIAVVLTVAAVTLLAAVIPTLRVTRIDPARTLREE
jgi:macrolide transport system ATP-binding/permease protein